MGGTVEPQSAKALLSSTTKGARAIISSVSAAFSQEWKSNPGTGARAALGKWVLTLVRHLGAISILAEEHDLSTVADVHYRQMFEIQLQVRRFLATAHSEHDRLAEKISAWGCIDFLDKLEPVKDLEVVRKGYEEMSARLSLYDPALVAAIRVERKKNLHWFCTSYTQLAREVSKPGEDLASVYRITSGGLHGVWDLTLGVANPRPGFLDLRGYPDEQTMFRWAADLVDMATHLLIDTWNDVAGAVGAPSIDLNTILADARKAES
jgi:hypothetical protein